MSEHIEDCTAILAQAMRITAQGKWHVFCEYAAHVDCLTVRWESADTDYAQTGRYSHEGCARTLDGANLQSNSPPSAPNWISWRAGNE